MISKISYSFSILLFLLIVPSVFAKSARPELTKINKEKEIIAEREEKQQDPLSIEKEIPKGTFGGPMITDESMVTDVLITVAEPPLEKRVETETAIGPQGILPEVSSPIEDEVLENEEKDEDESDEQLQVYKEALQEEPEVKVRPKDLQDTSLSALEELSQKKENEIGQENELTEKADQKEQPEEGAVTGEKESQEIEENGETVTVAPIEPETAIDVPPSYHVADIPIKSNKRIKAFIHMYTHRKRHVFELAVARSSEYMPMIHQIFKEHDLPLNLAYLAIVESNLNPTARSSAKAIGLWQFMSYTGKIFDLNRSWWHDDRRDPLKSTIAAAKYLKQLNRQFKGDWELALAAYNSGGGRVRRAIRKAKSRRRAHDYWSLRLPRETRGYVPAFYAVATIFQDLEGYGFAPAPAPEDVTDLSQNTTAKVPGGVSLKQVAMVLKTDKKKLKELNPSLVRGITPATYAAYDINLPAGVTLEDEHYKRLSNYRQHFWKYHRVRRGDTLWSISRRYGIPVQKIREFNVLRRKNLLRIGQKVMLPLSSDMQVARSKKKKVKRMKGLNYVHIVQPGDSLWKISQKYNVSIRELRKWNRIALRRKFLKIGMEIWLKLPIKVASTGSAM